MFSFDHVINEDACQELTYNDTAHKLVQHVRTEGGAGCFITLGLPRSGKTYTMEVSMCPHLPAATSADAGGCQRIRAHLSTPDTLGLCNIRVRER